MSTSASGAMPQLQRRGFLAGSAGLVVALAVPSAADAAEGKGGPSAERLDSWLAVGADGEVTASVGKIDAGLGIPTAFSQIVADELDVPLARVHIRMGDTATTVDQRGTGSSNGITTGGSALRLAAAQARAFLLARAAERFGVPVEQLETREGRVLVKADPGRSIAYAELLSAGRFDIGVDAKAKPAFKDARDYRYIGQPVPRADIAAKATAQFRYLVDFRVPGMVHARVLRPPTAGAKLLGVQSLPATPGFIEFVALGNFAAVVCEQEAQAVQAAREIRLKWSEPTFAFSASYDALYEHLRTAPAEGSKVDR
ncbi:MAG TPA: molybdopterin cofactor-binding domain-containing protein, partial [Ramlibacter sp.]|nr:molybdopterin cofactor-binding domain-containing protein [Ramlibacter sp.]